MLVEEETPELAWSNESEVPGAAHSDLSSRGVCMRLIGIFFSVFGTPS